MYGLRWMYGRLAQSLPTPGIAGPCPCNAATAPAHSRGAPADTDALFRTQRAASEQRRDKRSSQTPHVTRAIEQVTEIDSLLSGRGGEIDMRIEIGVGDADGGCRDVQLRLSREGVRAPVRELGRQAYWHN